MFKGTTQYQSKLKLIVEMSMFAWSENITNPGHVQYYQLTVIYDFLDWTQAKILSLYCSRYKTMSIATYSPLKYISHMCNIYVLYMCIIHTHTHM